MADGGVDVELFMRSLLGGYFQGATVREVVAATREVFFSPDERLYTEGEMPRFIYFLVDGEVALEREDAAAWTFGGGDVVGVLDSDGGIPHRRTARALTDVHALALRIEDWHDIQVDNLEMARLRIFGNASNLLRTGLSLAPEAGLAQSVAVGAPPSLVTQLSLEGALNTFERLLSLRLAPCFTQAGTQALLELAQEAREVRRAAEETLFEEGEPAPCMFILVSGAVDIERRVPAIRAQFGPTELVGGYMGIGHEHHPVTARASTDVVALSIDIDHLFDVMEDHYDLVRAMVSFMARERARVQEIAPPVASPVTSGSRVASVPISPQWTADLPDDRRY